MVTHAAGESGALYQDPYDGRFGGCTAVVLEAKTEDELAEIEETLRDQDVRLVSITESGGPYHGQLMALGVVPDERDYLGPIFSNYQCLKELKPPCSCSNCVDKAREEV
jgi:hypothetical protein